MEKYEAPKMEIIVFESEDVIVTSYTCSGINLPEVAGTD